MPKMAVGGDGVQGKSAPVADAIDGKMIHQRGDAKDAKSDKEKHHRSSSGSAVKGIHHIIHHYSGAIQLSNIENSFHSFGIVPIWTRAQFLNIHLIRLRMHLI